MVICCLTFFYALLSWLLLLVIIAKSPQDADVYDALIMSHLLIKISVYTTVFVFLSIIGDIKLTTVIRVSLLRQ